MSVELKTSLLVRLGHMNPAFFFFFFVTKMAANSTPVKIKIVSFY